MQLSTINGAAFKEKIFNCGLEGLSLLYAAIAFNNP